MKKFGLLLLFVTISSFQLYPQGACVLELVSKMQKCALIIMDEVGQPSSGPIVQALKNMLQSYGYEDEGKLNAILDDLKAEMQGTPISKSIDALRNFNKAILKCPDFQKEKQKMAAAQAKEREELAARQASGVPATKAEIFRASQTRGNNFDLLKFLLTNTVDFDLKVDGGKALIEAAMNSNKDLVQFWIAKGADVNAKSEIQYVGYEDMSFTPLMIATVRGNTEMVKMLLEAGADTNIKSAWGVTAWMIALRTGNENLFHLLSSKGVTPDAESASIIVSGDALLMDAGNAIKYIPKLTIEELDGQALDKKTFPHSEFLVPVAAGSHVLKVSYSSFSTSEVRKGASVTIPVEAESGSVYLLKYEIVKDTWKSWIEKVWPKI